jgi:hypothetical protein
MRPWEKFERNEWRQTDTKRRRGGKTKQEYEWKTANSGKHRTINNITI